VHIKVCEADFLGCTRPAGIVVFTNLEAFLACRRTFSNQELIALMVKHPDLIQRAIVVHGDQAVLGRPPENVEKLL